MSRHTGARHFDDFELALFASGDLRALPRLRVFLHVRGCRECREMVESFQESREGLRGMMRRLPAELEESSPEWQKLAAEMTANIHLGLEAGECIAQVPSSRTERSSREERSRDQSAYAGRRRSGWIPVANLHPMWTGAGIAAAAMFLIGSAWWLNLPTDAALLGRTFERLVGREPLVSSKPDSRGAMVQASTKGIEFRENGGSMGVKVSGTLPTNILVSFDGSASASYVDPDSDQVTVAKVYSQ